MLRGAQVTLVTGKTALQPPPFVEVVPVTTAAQMYEAVTSRSGEQDIIIKAAAVADFRPAQMATEKVKKQDGFDSLTLERTQDILLSLGEQKSKGQFLCGFAMETQDLLEQARAKMERKHLDMIVANNLKEQGAGFGTTTNQVTLLWPKGEEKLACMGKLQVAEQIVDKIVALRQEG